MARGDRRDIDNCAIGLLEMRNGELRDTKNPAKWVNWYFERNYVRTVWRWGQSSGQIQQWECREFPFQYWQRMIHQHCSPDNKKTYFIRKNRTHQNIKFAELLNSGRDQFSSEWLISYISEDLNNLLLDVALRIIDTSRMFSSLAPACRHCCFVS